MKPTIGRIVIYHPMKDGRDYVYQNNRDPDDKPADVPAVIVSVWSDNYVNLKVLADGHNDVWVPIVSEGTDERNWSWPIYA